METLDASGGAVVGEHEHLGDLLGRVEQLESSDPAPASAAQNLPRLLTNLSGAMQSHFGTEESQGGLYDSLRSADPMMAPALGRLVADHHRFLAAVHGLIGRAERAAAEHTDDLWREVQTLSQQLREHEAKESELTIQVRRSIEEELRLARTATPLAGDD